MARKCLSQFKNEDWIATIIGLILLLIVISMGSLVPRFPKSLDTVDTWIDVLKLLALSLVFVALGVKVLGGKIKGFLIAFIAIYAMSIFAQWFCSLSFVKPTRIESVFISVAIGLLIRNTVGLPKWLSHAVMSEYYIKIGLVLLGSSVIFGEIMKAGALGMIQSIVVVLSVWYFTFWLARQLKVDTEMGLMLSSAVSICGVSAAIATCGAIKGDAKKLSLVVSLVLVVAIPMMYFMPYLAHWLGLSQEVTGAWIGGTIDTTGAVVASGKFVGEVAEKYSVIIKSSQNVLLGLMAFAIAIYWSLKGTNQNEMPTVGIIWERLPKFVLGFLVASVLFSFALTSEQAKEYGTIAKGLRELMFSVGFICIGLETDFRSIFKKENRRFITTFIIAQTFNILITLIMALLLFGEILEILNSYE